ncbi:MAG TPA: hypothetical protein VNE39_22210 [Planctomycetota bacterium]|nr:hypothetical protein [Planctomycetota bacterium]
MEQDLNARVEDYRRRIKAQAEVTRKLEELVRGLEAGPAAEGGEQTQAPLRRARGELERSERDLKALKREYACFRLREALGPDVGHVEDEVYDDAILTVSSGRLTRHEARRPSDGPIAFPAFRTLLLADLPLGQLVDNEAAERKSHVLFDPLEEQTSTKNILRRWASHLAADPYVANILRCAADATARFRESLEQFTRTLEGLRINYELKQRKVDHLAFAFVGRLPALQAANYWENMERACPAEAGQLIEHFYSLDAARAELKHLREELNGQLRALMRCFFPRYVTCVMQQSKARQHGLGLARFHPRRLCRYALEQIDRTDFLLPRGSAMEIEVPRIPRELVAFRKIKSYARYRRQRDRADLADAPAVEEDADRSPRGR